MSKLEDISIVIPSAQLPRQIGETVVFERDIPLDTSAATVPLHPDGPVHVSGTLTCVEDGVYADLQVDGVAAGQCVRCLDDLTRPIDAQIRELFVEPRARQQALAGGDEEAIDWFELTPEGLDLTSELIDIVVGSLEDRPLCSTDCAGLCDQCGKPLKDDPGHTHTFVDPRWDALKALRENGDLP